MEKSRKIHKLTTERIIPIYNDKIYFSTNQFTIEITSYA